MTPDPESDRILTDLQALADQGVIDYVLPTIPLGEEWIVGAGTLIKMVGNDQAIGFITGANVAVRALALRLGIDVDDPGRGWIPIDPGTGRARSVPAGDRVVWISTDGCEDAGRYTNEKWCNQWGTPLSVTPDAWRPLGNPTPYRKPADAESSR